MRTHGMKLTSEQARASALARKVANEYALAQRVAQQDYAQAGVHPETAHALARRDAQEAAARALASAGVRANAPAPSPMQAALRAAGLLP